MKALFNDPTLLSLAEKYNKTVPQIALDYSWLDESVTHEG